jgi:hypothetical protein
MINKKPYTTKLREQRTLMDNHYKIFINYIAKGISSQPNAMLTFEVTSTSENVYCSIIKSGVNRDTCTKNYTSIPKIICVFIIKRTLAICKGYVVMDPFTVELMSFFYQIASIKLVK